MSWKPYRRTAFALMRPYVPGEDLAEISVSQHDHPKAGGMIARNPVNPLDQWYIDPDYFAGNFTPLDEE